MAAVVGFAFLVTVAMPVGKRFFPACHHLHPQRHALHGDNSRHGKKKRPLAVQKVRRWR